MRANERTESATRDARIILADECRQIRARFRACRRAVDPYLDELAGQRRGVKAADQLALIADTMLDGGYTPQEASNALHRMGRRIVDAVARRRAS